MSAQFIRFNTSQRYLVVGAREGEHALVLGTYKATMISSSAVCGTNAIG